ncbi:DnaJ-domain-containing protein [Panus rudis PR-1116 ss-1]|nr:DnaJ-domain-containing protein [Panus rudis PR-1116 ss-1]
MLSWTTMFPTISKIIGTAASSYFYLPIDEDETEDNFDDELVIEPHNRHISWTPSSSFDSDDSTFDYSSASSSSTSIASDYGPSCRPPPPSTQLSPNPHTNNSRNTRSLSVIKEILAEHDLYKVLGISKDTQIDRLTLRRAYLRRSKACHPDKFPGSPEATEAFQKVAVAYDVLSKPSSKRLYDSAPPKPYDFAAHPYQRAEETFRSVVLGVFNDFLDGDLETVRTLLRAVNDFNPSLRLGDDGIDAVLNTLQAIRRRALTCRTCILTLNAELSRLLEVQYAFRQLSYWDLRRRSRLTIELARIAISLPVSLDKALQRQKVREADPDPNPNPMDHDREADVDGGGDGGGRGGEGRRRKQVQTDTAILNRKVYRLLCAVAIVLEKMEKML